MITQPNKTIDNYYPQDKRELTEVGAPGFFLTMDGLVWSSKSKWWLKPTPSGYRMYNLNLGGGKIVTINADKLVSKFWVRPLMLAHPHLFRPYKNDPSLIICRTGDIFDSETGRFRNPSKGGRYMHFSAADGDHNVHRAVAETFVENPDNLPCVGHIDHNRWNNNADNLRWCTQAENLADSRVAGRMVTDGSVSAREKGKYQKSDGKKTKRPGITSMLHHVEGPGYNAAKDAGIRIYG